MSVKLDDGDNMNGSGSNEDTDNICRDYLRNVCRRGKRCKYVHPDNVGGGSNGAGGMSERGSLKIDKTELVFCHDYQNKECHRPNCKFMHCSRAEEEYYNQSGDLPQRILDGSGGVGTMDAYDASIPVCKDFQKGECHRGSRCKFRHIGAEFDSMDMGGRRGGRPDFGGGFGGGGGGNGGGGFGGGGGSGYDSFDYYEPERKRRMFGPPGEFGPPARQALAPPMPDYFAMEEENAFLRRKVDELKKSVTDLTATNEFLLDQNAQLRIGSKASQQQPVQQQMAQMSAAVAQEMATSQQAAVSMAAVSMAPSTLAQNPLVSYPIMTQSMRPIMAPNSMGH